MKMNIKHKWYNIIFTLCINVGMSMYITLFWHLLIIGPDKLMDIWLQKFMISFAVGAPFLFLLLWCVRKMMKKFFTISE